MESAREQTENEKFTLSETIAPSDTNAPRAKDALSGAPFCGFLAVSPSFLAANQVLFSRLVLEELSRVKARESIGLYAEKRLHSTLKRFFCNDLAYHEQKVYTKQGKATRYVADVRIPSGEIIEVQTGKIYPIRQKIAFLLDETADHVTLVHPLTAKKWVNWMAAQTGEITSRHRSPKRETVLHGLAELKPLLAYLGHPRFSVVFLLLELDEFRLLDGYGKGGKRGSHRYELMPLSLIDLVYLHTKEDFATLFPVGLPETFTAKTFGKLAHLTGFALYDVLAVFEGLGTIRKCGKQGRAALYTRCTDI